MDEEGTIGGASTQNPYPQESLQSHYGGATQRSRGIRSTTKESSMNMRSQQKRSNLTRIVDNL